MEINQQQKDFMEANRPHYNTLVVAEFLTNIGYDVKEGLLNIARLFDPGYQANLWCGPCVCDLVKYAYTQYDKWVAEQPKEVKPVIAPIVEEVIEDTLEVIKEPIIQKATFPKHDKPMPPPSLIIKEGTVKTTDAPAVVLNKKGRKPKAK